MRRQISIKTKFGWISVFEENDRIVKVKFGKYKNIYTSKNLKKFKSNLNAFLNRKSKSIKSNFIINKIKFCYQDFSKSNNFFFSFIPPIDVKPPKLPSVLITLWQGTSSKSLF